MRAQRLQVRDVRQFVYLVTAVILVALLGLFAFALLFNGATTYAWLFVAGAFVFRQGFVEYRNRSAVSGTATAKATSAAIGLAELCGRGHATAASEAPVTRTPSIYWKVELHQWQARSRRHGWNRKLRQVHQADTLELEDDTGRVAVWSRGAEIIPIKHVWRSQDGDPPEGGLRLVESIGLQWPEPSSRYPMKISEERIEQGGTLYVMGTLSERRQVPASPPRFLPALLDRWAGSSPRLENQSFAAALRFAGQGARRWLARDLQTISPAWLPPTLPDHQVLVWEGLEGRPFIISGPVERDALTALSRRSWLAILAGAALMVGTVWVGLLKLTHVIR